MNFILSSGKTDDKRKTVSRFTAVCSELKNGKSAVGVKQILQNNRSVPFK